MSKLSKSDIERMADVIEQGGKVVLDCDGYSVSLKLGYLTLDRKVRDVVVVHIDGFIKAEWCNKECRQSVFLRKELLSKDEPQYHPYWLTAQSALKHITKVSKRLEVTKELTRRQWIDEAPCF